MAPHDNSSGNDNVPPSTPSALNREVSLAVKNTVKLVLSMMLTIGVSFVVRFWIPRFLGPESFGVLHFAEQFALMMAFVIGFGADTYIRKEVAARPEHASDFFGGLILLRLGLSVAVFAITAVLLTVMNKDALTWWMVNVFFLAQIFLVLNGSLTSLLQAKGNVNEMSILNVVAKIVWGTGCIGGLLLGFGPISIAVSLAAAEALKTPVLLLVAKKHLSLKLVFTLDAAKQITLASLPFCLSFILGGINSKVDVTLLSVLTEDAEVGWYGAAGTIFFIIFLFIPLMRSVVMPMGARLLKESNDVLNQANRTALRTIVMFTIPMGALIALNAETIVGILFPDSFAPTARIVQVCAPIIPLTYITTMYAVHLVQLGGIWQVTKIALISFFVKAVFSPTLILAADRFLGDGGPGIGAGLASGISECTVAVLMAHSLRKYRPGDTTLAHILIKLTLVFLLVTAIHLSLPNGFWLIGVDVATYGIFAYIFKVLPAKDILRLVQAVTKRKKKK